MAKHRNRDRRPARRRPFRTPKPLILIVCEGQNTEPQYFEGFRNVCENPRVQVKCEGGAGVPRTIVDFAKELKRKNVAESNRARDENVLYEEIWCVFDVDNHPNLNDAIAKARDNDLKIAVSNESFELWLLLHFRDNPGMQSRAELRKSLKTYVLQYDKTVNVEDYLPGYHDAVRRATKMWDASVADEEFWGRNPVTNVFELTESIRGSSDVGSSNP